MRKHLALAVGVVSLACGGYLWTNNTAAFAANKNDQPAETITISSNPEDVTIECSMAGGEGMFMPMLHGEIAASGQPAMVMPAQPVVGATLHQRNAPAVTVDQLEITSQATATQNSKPLAILSNADDESSDCGIAVALGIDWFELAAETIGVSSEELQAGLENEVSIADQAAAKGVSKQTVIDALVAAETANINQLVADGEITADDAALMTADLASIIEEFVSTTQSFMPIDDVACTQLVDDASSTEPSDEAIECDVIIGEAIGIDWSELAAQTSGITTTDLVTGLDSGQSIAEQAAAKGINQQTIIDAIVAAETTFINQLVADGEITADEAQPWLADINQVVSDFVTRTDFMEVAPSEPQPLEQSIAPQR